MSRKTEPPAILQFVDYSHAILRQTMEPVTFPLSAEIQQLIAQMKYSIQGEQLKKIKAPWDSAAGMAANQWGLHQRIFLFCPDGDAVNGLRVIINPSYTPISTEHPTTAVQECAWEGCFSVPFATGKVKRYTQIHITYQNEEGTLLEEDLSGWPARVWQHETDHLNGLLYDDVKAGKCLDKKQFSSKEEVDAFHQKLQAERQHT